MKKGKHTEEQIIGVLKQVQVSWTVKEDARELGVSEVTIYTCSRVASGRSSKALPAITKLNDRGLFNLTYSLARRMSAPVRSLTFCRSSHSSRRPSILTTTRISRGKTRSMATRSSCRSASVILPFTRIHVLPPRDKPQRECTVRMCLQPFAERSDLVIRVQPEVVPFLSKPTSSAPCVEAAWE